MPPAGEISTQRGRRQGGRRPAWWQGGREGGRVDARRVGGGAPVGVDVLLGYITRVITTVSRQIINSRRRADRSLWQLNARLQTQQAHEESARWTTLNRAGL